MAFEDFPEAFDTKYGVFTAEARHVGKYVVAQITGFYWQPTGSDVDKVIYTLRNDSTKSEFEVQTGVFVVVLNLDDGTHLRAEDRRKDKIIRTCHLSPKGREQFIAVLESVMDRG